MQWKEKTYIRDSADAVPVAVPRTEKYSEGYWILEQDTI